MKTEVDCLVAAARLGVRFNGMQERFGKPPLALFTDVLETRSTFSVHEGETLDEALERIRGKAAT